MSRLSVISRVMVPGSTPISLRSLFRTLPKESSRH
jgi:hypothetical protein